MTYNNNVIKITQTTDYHVIQNRVLNNYPETKFDIGVVYEDDIFEFSDENGKLFYNHIIKNPFKKNKTIVGAYCFLKNRKGITKAIMDKDELLKCKNMSKNQRESSAWKNWESEMCLKAVLKRACKRCFYDEVKDLLEEDNENYDLSKIDESIERPKNSPFQHFLNLIKNLSNKDDLIKEWNNADGDIKIQRSIYQKVKQSIENGRNN